MNPLQNPRTIPFTHIEQRFQLAQPGFGTTNPPVLKTPNRYLIRVVTTHHTKNGDYQTWEYFKIRPDGVIIEAPSKHSKEFTQRVRVTGLDEAVQKYAKK